MLKFYPVLFALCFAVLSSSNADAGRLYARRAGTDAPVYNLSITHIRTTIQIFNQLAVTHVDEEFFNDNGLVLEGYYAFQLPEGAKVDGLWLWLDGQRLRFIVKKKEDATRMYDSVVIGVRRDPAILESLGSNRFQLKVWPINPHSSRRIEIQYFNTLSIGEDGKIHYSYPLNNLNYQTVPVQKTEMMIDVRGEQHISEFTTNFDDRPMMNLVTQVDQKHYTVLFGTENQNYTEDYHIAFRLEGLYEVFPVLTWANTDSTSEDPYFMMWFPLQETSPLIIPHDYTFVLDASGSMDGSRRESVVSAYKIILQSLGASDRFRLVLFYTAAISFPSDTSFAFASQQNIENAIGYIDKNYIASGGTNYQEAFRIGLSASYRQEADKRMIFLTDGEPTIGATDYQSIMSTIKQYDKADVRIYPVLLYTAQIKLLYDVANDRWGKATNIEFGEDISVVISRLLFDLKLSGYQDVSVTCKNNIPSDTYPRPFPAIVPSDQLITTGRFSLDGIEEVTLSYTSPESQRMNIMRSVALDRTHSSLIQVSRYWAAKKIDMFLDKIRLYGERSDLKDSIIALSIHYMILTPYTAFLVLENNPKDGGILDVAGEGTMENSFTLYQNYPNPFSGSIGNGTTNITFDIFKTESVQIIIYDVLGRVIRTLADTHLGSGQHVVTWDGRDDYGRRVHSGIYFCTMKVGMNQKSIRISLMK